MTIHFFKEVERLKRQALALGGMVEDNLRLVSQALFERKLDAAEKVIDNDRLIDAEEVEIEESCLKVLALHQPVASDLRYVIAVLKMNNDLERIGDLCVNIAKRVRKILPSPQVVVPDQISTMFDKARSMLRDCLDAMVRGDVELAKTVLRADKEIDVLNREVFDVVKQRIQETPDSVDVNIHLLTIARFIERLGDHTTNISEDVIYLMEGEIVRHNRELKGKNPIPPQEDIAGE